MWVNPESLLINRDIFKDETSIESMFSRFLELPDRELGYIRNQRACSNVKWHTIFYYNMNDDLRNKFELFCSSFGYHRIGEDIFYSHPSCCCNSPSTIYLKKAVALSLFSFEKEFIDWFNRKQFNERHFTDLDWCRLGAKDITVGGSFIKTMWNYITQHYVFKDSENNYYTPFNICDRLINESGCSSPIDCGYIKHKV